MKFKSLLPGQLEDCVEVGDVLLDSCVRESFGETLVAELLNEFIVQIAYMSEFENFF